MRAGICIRRLRGARDVRDADPARALRPAVACRPATQRGASAVEFALILPVLTMILLAIIEFGYAFFIQATVAGAARTGVRYYAINYAEASAKTNAIATTKAASPDPAKVLSVTFSGTCTPGDQTTLTLLYRYQSLTGLLNGVVGDSLTITGKGSMQCGG